ECAGWTGGPIGVGGAGGSQRGDGDVVVRTDLVNVAEVISGHDQIERAPVLDGQRVIDVAFRAADVVRRVGLVPVDGGVVVVEVMIGGDFREVRAVNPEQQQVEADLEVVDDDGDVSIAIAHGGRVGLD